MILSMERFVQTYILASFRNRETVHCGGRPILVPPGDRCDDTGGAECMSGCNRAKGVTRRGEGLMAQGPPYTTPSGPAPVNCPCDGRDMILGGMVVMKFSRGHVCRTRFSRV